MPDWPCELGEPLVQVTHQYALGYEADNDPARDLVTPLHAWSKQGATWKYLSLASKLDRIVWDLIVVRRNFEEHCDALTLLTKEIEFDALIFRDLKTKTPIPKITYFPVPEGLVKPRADRRYWISAGADPAKLKGLGKWFSELVVWNCYQLKGGRKKVGPAKLPHHDRTSREGSYQRGEFTRTSLVFRDRARKLFVNVPVPSKSIFKSLNEAKNKLKHRSTDLAAQTKAVCMFYDHFRKQTDCWVTAVGSPMVRNLESLSALLLDDSRRATLVTGLPGTGKEAYARALHFATQLFGDSAAAVFFTSTALELSKRHGGPVEGLREKVKDLPSRTRSVTFFIDELNKANKQDMLSELLRVVEEPNHELNINNKINVTFVFAASEHLDELTKRPSPQDFWTRISHQLRVVHPLGYVSEKDANAFLKGYFLYEWWKLVYKTVEIRDLGEKSAPHLQKSVPYLSEADFMAMMFGKIVEDELSESDLCRNILYDLLGSLVPLVTRDSLSVRGVRSIVGQVFARVLSHARYVSEDGDTREGKLALAIAVNCAIQDVLAVLNAARGVPRSGGTGHEPGTAPLQVS